MQIHELNPFQGTLGSEAFLVVDNGDDTGKISVERLTQPINDRIDDIITSPAPTEQEIIDARRGWNEVVYGSLGTAIRSQVKQILAQFYKFNTYDLLAVYGTPISRTRNGVTFTWDEAGQVCEVSGEAVGGDAYASIYTQTGAWQGIFERGVTYTIGYETTDPNVKLRIAVWEGVETTPDYYYFDENGHFGIPPEAAKIGVDLWVESGDSVSAVVKNVYMLRTYTAKEVTATIRDAMIGADLHMYNSLGDAIREQLNGKVDKVTGKVLSSNDFTDAEKTKLSGIEAGSEVNAIEAIKLDGTELTPDANRAVDIPVDETLTVEGVPADAKTVGEELENKLAIDGYSELATVGNSLQLVATQHITDTEPYNFRKTGGPNDVGDRVYDEIVGGSVVWNQLVKDGNFTDVSDWIVNASCSVSFANNVGTVTINDNTQTSARPNLEPKTMTAPQAGHKYLISVDVNPSKDLLRNSLAVIYGGVFFLGASTANTWNAKRTIVNAANTSNSTATLYIQQYVTLFDNGDTLKYRNYNIIDLTAALTPTIADYIYTLEQANAGAGVAWFKKYFPGIYHGHAEPHFEHVQVSAKNTVGFNQWDEEWEVGGMNSYTGENTSETDRIRSKNYIPILGNQQYCIHASVGGGLVCFYDSEKAFITSIVVTWSASTGYVFTPPTNAEFIRFNSYANYGKVYNHDICINLHGDRDGEYEPYRKRTYPLDSSLTLRGIPKLDSANRLYFDGDIYRHDGTYKPMYYEVDLGTLNWRYYSEAGGYFGVTPGEMPVAAKPVLSPAHVADMMVTKDYTVRDANHTYSTGAIDMSIAIFMNGALILQNESYTDAASLKATLSGIYIIYKVNEPTTETAEPYQSPMVVDPLGTEDFVDYAVEQGERDVKIPVGHTSEYPADLRGKLQHLPSLSTSGDGRYVVVQTGNQMTLSPDTSLGLIAALEARVAALEGGN